MSCRPESIVRYLVAGILLAAGTDAQATPATSLGSAAAGQAGNPTTVTFSSLTGTPASYHMAYGLEFTLNVNSCSGSSCSVTFSPRVPGLRQDALLAIDGGGNIVGTEFVYGIGQGPLSVLVPGTISTLYAQQGVDYTFGIAKDSAGNIYFSNSLANTVQKIDTLGNLSVVAGTGIAGFAGDGGLATSAELQNPAGLAIDGAGNLYIADTANSRVRRVNAQGIISTFAGSGCYGYSGDGAAATAAALSFPYAVTDFAGILYIADSGNNVVRKVDVNGIISTFAGMQGQSGANGDNGLASGAQIGVPGALAIDAAGNLYIADEINFVVRKVNASSGIITTIAGTGTSGYSGDGGPATSAGLGPAYGLTLDPAGNVYITDADRGYIRKVDTQGQISSIAGNGAPNASSGDGGPATSAGLESPSGIVAGDDGSLYVASGTAIRKVAPTASLLFPSTAIGSSSPLQTLSLFNIGNQDQSLSELAVSGDFALSGCSSSTVLSNTQPACILNLTFVPTQPGARIGILTIPPNLLATLTGNGLGAAKW
jgi:sugar lactone lactonase YvrE